MRNFLIIIIENANDEIDVINETNYIFYSRVIIFFNQYVV